MQALRVLSTSSPISLRNTQPRRSPAGFQAPPLRMTRSGLLLQASAQSSRQSTSRDTAHARADGRASRVEDAPLKKLDFGGSQLALVPFYRPHSEAKGSGSCQDVAKERSSGDCHLADARARPSAGLWKLAVGSVLATSASAVNPPSGFGVPLAAADATTVALTLDPAYGEVSAVLEMSVLLLYLGGLLALLAFGTFLVVRQVLVRRELENAAKDLQDRVRTGQASSEEYFELGAVMLRKKFYTLANKYLLQAITKWEGDEQELAQVHNALGFSYFSEEKLDKAIAEYEKAVSLQPAYVTAWNNMANAWEKQKELVKALRAYESTLMYDPNNRIASERKKELERKVSQLSV